MCATTQPCERMREAFELFAWRGWTFEQAIADPIRSRLLNARAAAIACQLRRATHSRERVLVRRINPSSGRWCTTTHAGSCSVPSLFPTQD